MRRGAICVTARVRSGDEQHMEEGLLPDSEYVLLRGSLDCGFTDLLKKMNVTAVREIGRDTLWKVWTCISEAHRKKAMFLMNAVTLYELYLSSAGSVCRRTASV